MPDLRQAVERGGAAVLLGPLSRCRFEPLAVWFLLDPRPRGRGRGPRVGIFVLFLVVSGVLRGRPA